MEQMMEEVIAAIALPTVLAIYIFAVIYAADRSTR
jgi:hypothetical protein